MPHMEKLKDFNQMINELNHRLIKAAERMVVSLDKMYEVTHKLEIENASRMVWLVGISGFAILNLPNVFSQEHSLSYSDFITWLITAIFGVLAHWSHRNVSIQNFNLYVVKRESLLNFIINGAENAIFDDLQQILSNKINKLQEVAQAHNRATTIATRFEQITFLSFLVGLILFVWKFIQRS
jgi:hypothetical protein